jgi:transcriptional regulator with XRE-family HTH domain
MTSILITNDMLSLYEKEYSRQEVATELNVSIRTVSRYLIFGAQYIPDLEAYLDSSGYLNRKRVESSHVEYLREIADLLNTFSRERTITILTRKYSPKESE